MMLNKNNVNEGQRVYQLLAQSKVVKKTDRAAWRKIRDNITKTIKSEFKGTKVSDASIAWYKTQFIKAHGKPKALKHLKGDVAKRKAAATPVKALKKTKKRKLVKA